MALLSTFVRPDDAKPPLALISGVPYFIICNVWMFYAIWIAMPSYQWWGWALHVAVSAFCFALDGWCANWAGKNFVSLRANGFSDGNIAATMLFNLSASQALTMIVFQMYSIVDPVSIVFASSNLGVWLARVVQIAINLGMTEIAFYFAHRALHLSPTLSPLHKMHHCCRWASNTTNVLFHPLDLVLEFAGPYVCVVGMHQFAWSDDVVLFLSLFIVQMWYVFSLLVCVASAMLLIVLISAISCRTGMLTIIRSC
jgi:hypothetical protein